MAIDYKYGRIYREDDVIAMLDVANADVQIEDVVAGLQASGHDFHIGVDEPVVVFRAQDKLLPKLLGYYHMFCLKVGSPREHLNLILDSREAVVKWQEQHEAKVPTSASFTRGH